MGTTVTKKGYIRITSGEHRHKYQHRRAIEKLLEEVWHPFYGNVLPGSVDVHHVDHLCAHNCVQNLLVLDRAIHSYISKQNVLRCPYTGRFLTREEYNRTYGPNEDLPDWVTKEVA